MIVRRGEVELAVDVQGPAAAPAVLLVHGYPDTRAVWSAIVPRLARAHRVITYDVRGAGASTRPGDEAAYDLRELADDAAAVIDACADGRAVHVVGHDWGAIQSWELVTSMRAEGRVASFTSISGPCLDHVAHWMRGAARSPGRLSAVLAQAPRSIYIAALRVPGLAERVWPALAPRWPALRDLAERGGLVGAQIGRDSTDARPETSSSASSYARVGDAAQTRADHGAPTSGTERVDLRVGEAAPTLAADGATGARLYRRNVLRRLRAPREDAHAHLPVQVVVPLRDRFVSRALAAEAAAPWCEDLRVRELDAGHWCVRSAPDAVARAIEEHVAGVERRRSGTGTGVSTGVGTGTGSRAGTGGEIRPRRVSFDLSRTPVPWIPRDRFTSHVTDVLHLLLPAGERWFVDVYREALPLVRDERLRADMKGFMGQEATHARVHDLVLDHLRAGGVDTEPFTRRVEWMFAHVFGAHPPPGVPLTPRLWLELRLGGIAAVEHFTCVLGRWICERSAALDAAGADPAMLALLRWHGAEEIEHRSVAFDTLTHVAGRRAYVMRAAGMLLAAPIMTWLWDRGTSYFVDRDPAMADTRGGYRDFLRAARQRRVPGRELVTAIPRFLSRGYHPRHEASSDVARAHLQNAR